MDNSTMAELDPSIQSRYVQVKDMNMFILECYPPEREYGPREKLPLVLLLHGFPSFAYAWRKIMPTLAKMDKGLYIVAPDQRGCGRTAPGGKSRIKYDDDSEPFRMANLVDDIAALVKALGREYVQAVAGHDFGAIVAGYSAAFHPDVFKSLVIMSAPFSEPPPEGFRQIIEKRLGSLSPPKKHYTIYYSGPDANSDMLGATEDDLRTFLKNYFYVKSGSWSGNDPRSIDWEHIMDVPGYYVMPLEQTMTEVVSNLAAGHADISSWLPDAELDVYVTEFMRTGFQGGLNWYRRYFGQDDEDLRSKWKDRKGFRVGSSGLYPPAVFLAGNKDWGVYQIPESFKKMETAGVSTDALANGIGHWTQEESEDPWHPLSDEESSDKGSPNITAFGKHPWEDRQVPYWLVKDIGTFVEEVEDGSK